MPQLHRPSGASVAMRCPIVEMRPASIRPGLDPSPRQRLSHLRGVAARRPRRIYQVNAVGGNETWFWGVSFQVTKRKSYARPRVAVQHAG
jgi:hypothetical protein